MVHVGALPGSPAASHSIARLVEHAVAEARAFRDAGFTAVAIENMHDRPYLRGGVGPEVTAAMAVIGREIRRETSLILGVQVLAGANREALAVAHATGAAFVRVEGFVFAHVADEGLIEASATACSTSRAIEWLAAGEPGSAPTCTMPINVRGAPKASAKAERGSMAGAD